MKKGFTLIDVLVGSFLTLLVFLGIFGVYQLGLKVIGQSQRKIAATAVASGQIEKIRNLPYQSVGIIDGELPVAEGTLPSSSSTTLNNIEYLIERRIEYISDEIGQDIECHLNYKRAEVKVSWKGSFSGEVKMITDIAPKNILEEIASCEAQPGGILSIKVFNAYGEMVNFPLIEIFDAESGEALASYSPESGEKNIPLATSTYKVIASKDNYSTSRTYGVDEIADPAKPNPLVLEGETTEISFSIDKVGTFSVNTLFPGEEGPIPIDNTEFNLRGEKLIGYDVEENPVYRYSIATSTDSNGYKNLPNLEWDNYFFSVSPETNLQLVGIEPEPDESGAVGLTPDTTLEVNLYLESENSLLVTVKDEETSEPIFSSTVRLHNTEYDNTLHTDEEGRTLFIPLEEAVYNLEIESPGYLNYQGQISVFEHTKEVVGLTRVE